MLDVLCWVSAGNGVGRRGAIACIELAGDIGAALSALGVADVAVGAVRRRSVPVGKEITDDAVIARWSSNRATVMTHGGPAVVDGFLATCSAAGLQRAALGEDRYPEAADGIERAMLAALARAQSPAAVELLLDQPRRWREHSRAIGRGSAESPLPGAPRDMVLRRLIEPALIVAVGPPNIGKSSLLNALAGRSVAMVADQPGITRDHVGVLINLAGVVVRWVDTPGLDANGEDRGRPGAESASGERVILVEAQRLARALAETADVVVVCVDEGGNGASIEAPSTLGAVVRVGLRADLAGAAPAGVAAAVSVKTGVGLEQLVELVREAVVPRRWLEDGTPWRFWGEGSPD
jgi:tRNA modification GTPase